MAQRVTQSVESLENVPGKLAVYARPSRTRGYADHGWLKTYHTFSFADYYDPNFEQFGPLRVVNEDRVQAGRGFGKHPHKRFEIYTYVVSGRLTHRDSLGNVERLERGDVQFTSAGQGLSHSEENEEQVDAVKFLQIWSDPGVNNLPCRYETKRFSDDRKLNRLLPIVVPKARARELDAIGLEADMYTYACLLESGQSVTLAANAGPGAATPRRAYVHVVDTGGKVRLGVPGGGDANAELASGDAAFVTGLGTDAPTVLEIRAVEAAADGKPVELLVFELPGKAEGVQQQ